MQNQIPKNEVLKYKEINGTYISFLQENFLLIKRLISIGNKNFVAFNKDNLIRFYKGRALHLQVMSLIGLNAEHLVKLILAKRGYILNKISYIKLKDGAGDAEINYSHFLIGFKESINLFNNSNPTRYFSKLKSYVMNPDPDIYDGDSYFGRKFIKPNTCLDLLVDVRNSYLHHANAQGEQNGVIWYIYNFSLWLARKEFKDKFSIYRYIGNEDVKKLFTN